jgi:capsular exopolysaccharide synthesis family protein
MDIRAYIEILWRRKWVIAVTVVGTLMATPMYAAATTLRVLTPSSGTVDWASYDMGYTNRLMNTYAEIAASHPVLEELVQRLGIHNPPQIEVEIVPNTELIQITVEDPNPILVAEAANVLADILIAQSRELYTGGGQTAREILGQQLAQIEDELSQARGEYEALVAQAPEDSDRVMAASRSIALKEQTYATLLESYERARVKEAMQANTVFVVEPAATPQAPSKPHKKMNVALGFMVGLAGGVGLAFLFENLDTTLYTVQQIEEVAALSILGKIPIARKRQQITLFNGNSPQAEAFRRLRTNVFALDHKTPFRTLMTTSAEPREGKSTIVANLALAMAQTGHEVIVVDGDLRLPTVHKIFALPNEVGLSSVLQQEATLDEAIQRCHVEGVQVLTSGPRPPNPTELLDSARMTTLIKQLAYQFDVVLLDTPSLLAVTDAVVLARSTDGVLLVVGRTQARRETVQSACQHLADVQAHLVGVIMNRAERDSSYDYYHPASPRRGWTARGWIAHGWIAHVSRYIPRCCILWREQRSDVPTDQS